MIINRFTFIRTMMIGGAMAFGSSNIMAQTFGAEYTTEWQTDFKGRYNWLNLLKTTAELPVSKNLSFEVSTISTAKCHEDDMIDDVLCYSNIEAGNIPLTFARLGFGVTIKNAELFVGINNVNEEYFTSDLTSFFINSSCGISPTISCNFDIANYPFAAWCVHYSQHLGNLSFHTSLYPGKGYYRIFGHDNLFGVNFKRDGVFSISSINYKRNGIYTVLGVALHYGVCIDNAEGEQIETQAAIAEKRFSASPWILSEINLTDKIGIHAHGSYSTVKNGCKGYAGIGFMYNGKRVQPAVSFNYASFTSLNEYAFELCARMPIMSEKAYIQPALHLVGSNQNSLQCVGLFRFNVSI